GSSLGAEALLLQANLEYELGRYESSEESYRSAWYEAELHGRDALRGHAMVGLASILSHGPRYKEALQLARNASAISVRLRDDALESVARRQVANLLWAQGKLAEALPEAKKAVHIPE